MKKLFAMFLSLCMILSMAACGQQEAKPAETAAPVAVETAAPETEAPTEAPAEAPTEAAPAAPINVMVLNDVLP